MPQRLLEEEGEEKSDSHQSRKNRQFLACSEDHGHQGKEGDEDDDSHHAIFQEGRGFQALELQLALEVGDGFDDGVDWADPATVKAGEE